MNSAECAMVLRKLHAAYRTEITEDIATLWANVFSDAEGSRVLGAVTVWVNTQSYFPTPADIRAAMRNEPSRMELPSPPSGKAVPFPEGIAIAYDAYCAEKRKLGAPALSYERFRGSAFMARIDDGG